MSDPIQVLIVDDHPALRAGVRIMLELGCQDIEVVGEAQNGREAVEFVVHLLITDLVQNFFGFFKL